MTKLKIGNSCCRKINKCIQMLVVHVQVTRTAKKSQKSSKFGQIQPWTVELAALDQLEKNLFTYLSTIQNILMSCLLLGHLRRFRMLPSLLCRLDNKGSFADQFYNLTTSANITRRKRERPMSINNGTRERYDFVVFGATGVTGQHVVEEMTKQIQKKGAHFTMAVAGNCEIELRDVLKRVSVYTGSNITPTPIILADTRNNSSLREMCRRAKVLLNCVGPYYIHGEQVVKACIEEGSHHLDVSGEPLFLERIQLVYQEEARKSGVYLIGGCGAPSILNDLGVNFVRNTFNDDVKSIDSYLKLTSGSKTHFYFCLDSFFHMAVAVLLGYINMYFAKYSFSRQLIAKHPEVFTYGKFRRGGPTREQVKESGFSLTFVAKTQNETSQVTAKDEPMITRIHGPELAYVTSAICLVQCGLTLLREQDKMPERGGVYTTASAFSKTTLLDRLQVSGIRLDVTQKQDPLEKECLLLKTFNKKSK